MDKIEKRFKEIRKFCELHVNPANVKKYSRFFTEGYDAYGLDKDTLLSQRDKWLEEWKNEFSIEDYLLLGDKLVSTGKYEEASFAITFLYSNFDKLKPEMFDKIGLWLENGIANWGHTDVLSEMVLAFFFKSKMIEIEVLNSWISSKSIWKRRAIPVTLIEILKEGVEVERIFAIITPIMEDDAKKVQQGLGWLLRETWKKYPELTEDFLLKWKDTCGRTIIQYATEKMAKEERLRFRRKKA